MEHLSTFAYLDPGTGSMIIQALVGAVAGVALFGRKAVRAVSAKLGSKKVRTLEKSVAKPKK